MDQFKKAADVATRDALKVVGDDIIKNVEKTYQSVISHFYSTYKPHVYRRKEYDGTRGASNAADILPDPIIQNGYLEAGIEVSPKNIPGNPYRHKDKDWVFGRTYLEGIHGFTKDELLQWQRSKDLRDQLLRSLDAKTAGEWHISYKRKRRADRKNDYGSMKPVDPPPVDRMEKKLNAWWNKNKKRLHDLYCEEFARTFESYMS